jgi:hypothetical protein
MVELGINFLSLVSNLLELLNLDQRGIIVILIVVIILLRLVEFFELLYDLSKRRAHIIGVISLIVII